MISRRERRRRGGGEQEQEVQEQEENEKEREREREKFYLQSITDPLNHQSPIREKFYLQSITNHQSPITNHQSPITNHQSPIRSITNHRSAQSPITNHQSPIRSADQREREFICILHSKEGVFVFNVTAPRSCRNTALMCSYFVPNVFLMCT
jgi:hypothetical protein